MINRVGYISSKQYNYKAVGKSEQNKASFKDVNDAINQQSDKNIITTDNHSSQDETKVSFEKLSTNSEKLRAYIEEQNAKIKERIKNGEDAPSFQIGASSMTEKEWDKLIQKVDNVLEAIKERQEKEEKEKEQAKQEEKQKVESVELETSMKHSEEVKEIEEKFNL